MDKGAHFHRCDFQVHSPRDRQWSGTRPQLESERQAYAAQFIAECRDKGLAAVAITDHHDMAFASYIRKAAAEELDASGSVVADENRIVVFPGMELTLGVPCQALLIFDAEFPEDLFSLATTALTIVPAAGTDDRTAETVRLDHIRSLQLLHEELDKHTYLKGRYIILPNVSEGGSSTLLRTGHSGHYRDMPCVGGYLDGSVQQLGDGNVRILSGRDHSYGNKALGLFQTSDCRRRDLSDLGNPSTWVKWAKPTAEALRQACLARQTRLSQTEPAMPASSIVAIDVSNSSFLGPIYLQLNPQYNALIGGRGTGKSSILEYLRWGLCDERLLEEADELPVDASRLRKVVDQTLKPWAATVQVHLSVNGVPHIVRRAAETGEVSIRIAGGPFETCKESDVRSLLPIQAYSQKQLSSVGVRVEELRRFVNTPILHSLVDLRAQLAAKGNDLRGAYSRLRSKRQLEADLVVGERELKSLEEQTAAIRRDLTGVDEKDREILALQPSVEREDDFVREWAKDLTRARAVLKQAIVALGPMPSHANATTKELPHSSVIESIRLATHGAIDRTRRALVSAEAELEPASGTESEINSAMSEWRTVHEGFLSEYNAAIARSSAHESKLEQLEQLEKRSKIVRERVMEKRANVEAAGDPEIEVTSMRGEWYNLHERKFVLVEEQCRHLTAMSDQLIKATLIRGGAATEFHDRFRSVVSGTGIAKAKVDKLWENMASDENPLNFVQRLLAECETLSVSSGDNFDLSTTSHPLLRAAGLSDKDLTRLSSKLTTDVWLDLCVVPIDDQPLFEYRLRENDYIPFAQASAGQQATALLWALLNQSGPPLLVDQPEDDLDNQVVLRVVEQLWRAKGGRQLIFVSHNANIVVNGDADLVVCCDYRIEGEQAGGRIKLQGAIDVPDVRDEIATVMEGGKAAFTLRSEKYGF